MKPHFITAGSVIVPELVPGDVQRAEAGQDEPDEEKIVDWLDEHGLPPHREVTRWSGRYKFPSLEGQARRRRVSGAGTKAGR
jgi:hypothetical protein